LIILIVLGEEYATLVISNKMPLERMWFVKSLLRSKQKFALYEVIMKKERN
jgi:hypothetical protein